MYNVSEFLIRGGHVVHKYLWVSSCHCYEVNQDCIKGEKEELVSFNTEYIFVPVVRAEYLLATYSLYMCIM